MSAVVEVRELRRSFGDVHAGDGVDLSIEQGEIFALLGPDGAIRTMLVEALLGPSRPPPLRRPPRRHQEVRP